MNTYAIRSENERDSPEQLQVVANRANKVADRDL